MDFSISGSDSWETTAAQESFINSYFQEQKLPISSKTLKKKGKRVQERNFVDDLNHQKKKKLMELPIEECPQLTEMDSVANFSSKLSKKKLKRQIKDVQKSTKINAISNSHEESPINHDLLSTENKISKKLKNKSKSSLPLIQCKLKMNQPEKNVRSVSEQDEFIPLEPNPVPKSSKKKKMKKNLEQHKDMLLVQNECLLFEPNSSPKHLKKKKTKKTLELNEDLDLNQNEFLLHQPDSAPENSKKKKVKKVLELDEDLDLECYSGDSCQESDEELMSDIKNSEVFREISEFMKQSPFQSNLKGSKLAGKLSAEDSDESFSNLPDDGSDNSSEVTSVPKMVKVASNVKKSSMLPENKTASSKVRTSKEKEYVPEKVSSEYGGLKSQNDSKSKVQNVNSQKQTIASALKNKAQQKLQAAKFRFLNEKLYTETGENAFQYFQENVEEFHDYHQGYSLQVSKWPMNPVNKIISDLQSLKKNIVIADMGCGDAKIAQTLTDATVHSFDIVPLNELVQACDISKVPLQNESVDVVVFCLSLMGTNLKDYLIEAHRILKMGGTLKIAEVESRMDVKNFVKNLKPLGFSLQKQDLKHKVFMFLDFKKEKSKFKKANIPSITMRPCLYKKR